MKNKSTKIQNNVNGQQTVEVLYQKMGDRWFAFSLIDDEVFVGSLSAEEIAGMDEMPVKIPSSRSRHDKISGNS